MPRPHPISLERCTDQSRTLRASAAANAIPAQRARLTRMADAYDSLAARIERRLRPRIEG